MPYNITDQHKHTKDVHKYSVNCLMWQDLNTEKGENLQANTNLIHWNVILLLIIQISALYHTLLLYNFSVCVAENMLLKHYVISMLELKEVAVLNKEKMNTLNSGMCVQGHPGQPKITV